MQAVILAAGIGKRLKALTQNNTKCMVEVNGVSLIHRMLQQLEKQQLSRIIIVVGYEKQVLIDYIKTLDIKTPIIFVDNPIYNKTNNIYSLALAKDYLCEQDTLLFESDLIFDDDVIGELINDPQDALVLVDKYESWMDGTCVKLREDNSIEEFVPGKKFKFSEIQDYYKTVNIYKFGKNFSSNCYVPFLDAYSKSLGNNEYYEQVLSVISILDEPGIKAKKIDGKIWYEIDDIQDLDIAESLFAKDDKKIDLLSARYGGYWRYPKLTDFCYLVNPYFPPKKLVDEIKANFETLLTEYPSGMRVNSLLAAKKFNLDTENIIIGNGAAELIKSLMEKLSGKIGQILPTFEEYTQRAVGGQTVAFIPENDDFSYNADDIINFFNANPVENLVIINPDNPTGNYIPKAELLRIISWAKNTETLLVIDESFVDFADEDDSTLITREIILNNPHLYVVKSISKSYGVPGLRLGVIASGNKAMIESMKRDVSIWNINSFAEFYMQIEGKYEKDYMRALGKIRAERKRYEKALGAISGMKIIPSQANYIMAELTNGQTARELTRRLMVEHNIFIKDLSNKIRKTKRQYIRIAVRNTADNDQLIEALKSILK